MAAAQHGNGFNPERTKECVARIEAIAAKKEAAHMAYMQECSRFAEDTKAVYDEAKSAWGIPKRSLKAVIKVRVLEKKVEDARDALDGDDQESFDQIRHALGDLADTPLGAAALDGKEEGSKPARGKNKPASDALDAATSNGEKIASGIRELH